MAETFEAAPALLLEWFRLHRRPLPWRTPEGTPRDPWRTLVSEVMSQQTRLEVVVPRFAAWMARWPSPEALADAPEEDVLSEWAGLGYYARARNLRRAARAIAASGWPRQARDLEALPGIGSYTAAAVASLAFGERVPMVDGNVARVLSRVGRIEEDPRSGPGARRLRAAAEAWVAGAPDAGLVNEATMELGALSCLPRSPRCGSCPLDGSCRALAQGDPERLPRKAPRRATVDRESVVAVVRGPEGVLLRRAGEGELLRGHWTLPEEETLPPGFLRERREAGSVRHAITHHRIAWTVVAGRSDLPAPAGMEWHPAGRLRSSLVSSLPRKALAVAGIPV